jgi:cytochrome c-type biogenesis protein CcmH
MSARRACRQWRDLIRTMLAEGKSEEEIKQYFVAQYGARVLAEPPNRLVTYLVPAVVILLGAFLLFRGFQMWMKPPITEAGVAGTESVVEPSQDPYIARLEEELKKKNNM